MRVMRAGAAGDAGIGPIARVFGSPKFIQVSIAYV
jgi:hypothetical protein